MGHLLPALRRGVAAVSVVATAALAAPAPAGAHGFLTIEGSLLHYIANDAGLGVPITLSSPQAGVIQLLDTGSRGGFDWGPCLPKTERRALCQSKDIDSMLIEPFDGDDTVTVEVATPAHVVAGDGNDAVTGGSGADWLEGGAGNDTLTGGLGADTISGDEGDDTINSRDGAPDNVSCGPGADVVLADPLDTVAPSECETVMIDNPPPDTQPPALTVSVPAKLPLRASRSLAVGVTSSEPGSLTLRGQVMVGHRIAGKLHGASAAPDAPGQLWTLHAKLPPPVARAVSGALARGENASVTLSVTADDGAGNRSSKRARVRLVAQ